MTGFKTVYRDIEIRGAVYPTIKAAALAHGVRHNTVLKAFHAGRLDKVGLGTVGFEGLPVRIRDSVYKDAKTAAAAFGVTKAAIYKALNEGNIDSVGGDLRGGANAIPFEIGGLRWPSRRAASINLGFRPGYVQAAFQYGRKAAHQCILGAAMALAAQRSAAIHRKAA